MLRPLNHYLINGADTLGTEYNTILGLTTIFSPMLTTPDTTPAAWSFTDETGIEPEVVSTHAAITFTAMDAGTSWSVTGAGTAQKNSTGSFSTSGTLNSGDTLTVKHTNSASYETETTTTLHVGTSSDTYSTTTRASSVDITPDAFTFNAQTGLTPLDIATSNTITLAGMTAATNSPYTFSSAFSGEYKINAGSWITTATGNVQNGDQVTLRFPELDDAYEVEYTATFTVDSGSVGSTFSATTQDTHKLVVQGDNTAILTLASAVSGGSSGSFGVITTFRTGSDVTTEQWIANGDGTGATLSTPYIHLLIKDDNLLFGMAAGATANIIGADPALGKIALAVVANTTYHVSIACNRSGGTVNVGSSGGTPTNIGWTVSSSGTPNWASSPTTWAIGAKSAGVSPFLGQLGVFLFATTGIGSAAVYWDSGRGKPADFGPDGTYSGITTVPIFFGGRQRANVRTDAETSAGWNDGFNQGTGGNFTKAGSSWNDV